MAVFPSEFADLDIFADWALPTERARMTKRVSASWPTLVSAYDALAPRMDAALAYLSKRPAFGLGRADEDLMLLTLSFAEIAFAVENYRAPDSPYAVSPKLMTVVNEPIEAQLPWTNRP